MGATVTDCPEGSADMRGPVERCTYIVEDEQRWRRIVTTIFYYDSIVDNAAVENSTPISSHIVRYPCAQCDAIFATEKVMLSHQRVKHGVRVLEKTYCDDSGVCPVCKTNFKTRLRCIRHLTDKRRQRCRMQLHVQCLQLPPEEVKRLDDLDTVRKREAYREGHSHVMAAGVAKHPDGKQVGRVSR